MSLIKAWQEAYEVEKPFNGRKWDQRPFRKLVYQSNIRFAVLTPEYNLMNWVTVGLGREVKILHGRRIKDLYWMEKNVNVTNWHRGFIPDIGVLPAHCATPLKLRTQLLMRANWLYLVKLKQLICYRLGTMFRKKKTTLSTLSKPVVELETK